ncbi:AhpC/TSA family protein [Parapedobacter indicus]|uniref:AhpC/TSA family protein n=2 Tax=Sphingobacteriaceae TaxID=84566 RepID=A0A1I3CLD4_9SPHI|nr:AhpC/TSA family protein [Parapedobacter indicus]SFH75238.1 AhpC/TSA family protein [Parapedobacter indicus]
MKKIKLSMVMLLLLFQAGYTHAQTYSVGDSLPEEFFSTVHPAMDLTTGESTTVKLEDYRDKLVILYFWFNGCSPCIRSFIKCDSIQPLLKGENYVVIPFTYQTLETTQRILRRFQWNMTSIIADSVLYEAFAGRSFRNTAWIKDGRVYATPESKFLTAENIRKVLAGHREAFPLEARQPQRAGNQPTR